MKVLLLLGFTLFIFKSYGQTDTSKIYNSSQLKKGIYADYKEFINNSPSITWDFIVNRHTKSKIDSTIITANFKFTEKGKFVNRLWGFCDGEYAYINFGNSSAKKAYWKLDYPGRYSFFTFAYSKKNILIGPPILTVITLASALAAKSGFDIMIVNEKGNAKYPDHALLKKILSSQSDLESLFEKDWEKVVKYDESGDEFETDEIHDAKINIIKKYLAMLNERIK